MKIGMVTYALDRNLTGIGHYTRNLLHGMSRVGHHPVVLRSGGGLQGENVYPLIGCNLLPLLITLGQIEIGWYARKFELDVVHDPTGTAPLALCHPKKVVTLCDVFPLSIPGYSTSLDTLIYRYWLPRIVGKMDRVITISHHSKKDICEYLHIPETKVDVIPLAADIRFRPLSEGEIISVLTKHRLNRPYILFVGSLEPRKNLLLLLEAYSDFRQKYPKWGLVIVGIRNYWKPSPITSKVEELDLQNHVTFTGYVPDEDLPAIYNGADLFCFPSLYEGFGLPVLEAMACGTPVLTSNTSSLPEVAGNAAMLVNPNSVEEVADSMQKIIENPELAQSLREKGLKQAQKFSWDRTARETIKVYEEVLESN